MRINQKLASLSDLSRRQADAAITAGRVAVNGIVALLGQEIGESDLITLDGVTLESRQLAYIAINKPVGYIVSRSPQGNGKSVYDLLPPNLQSLQYVGRLDKDSSGLLLFTNDGPFINQVTHPSQGKLKRYQITLDKNLRAEDARTLVTGIQLDDGPSRFESLDGGGSRWELTLAEGRNRQIRRSFDALGYTVRRLHRTGFGRLQLGNLAEGQVRIIAPGEVL